jgi:hypothetical protein
MKINEFEEKLGTVSDTKLRQMLSASRANGPDVAVQLILNEGKRRGLDGLDAPSENALERAPGSETSAYPQESAGYAGADAPPEPVAEAAGTKAAPGDAAAEGDPAVFGDDAAAPATSPDWLNEETRSGLPVPVKVLLLVAIVGAILGLAWKFTH